MPQERENDRWVIDDRERGVFRVHRSVFTDPDILALERERIFDRCWIYAAHASEVKEPGDFVTRRVAGRPVIVSRGADGNVHVLLNSCSHRGALICREPTGNVRMHRCPYHGWCFNPQGELCAIPGKTAYSEAFDRDEFRLREPPGGTSAYRDFVFVNFNPDNDVSLNDYLADAKDYIDLVADQSAGRMEVVGGTHSYSTRGNYKLIAENSLDGYHAMSTHKRYFEWLMATKGMSGLGAGLLRVNSESMHFRPRALGNGHSMTGRAVAPWGRPMAQWVPHFGEHRKPRFDEMYRDAVDRLGEQRAHEVCMRSGNIQIFPNLVINDIMATNIRSCHPIRPGYSEVDSWCLAPEEERPEERALRLDNHLSFLGPSGFALPDDMEVVELCQRGYETVREIDYSDVSRGMKSAELTEMDELQIRAFWRQWARLMTAPEPVSVQAP